MPQPFQVGNATHDANVATAANTRQTALASASTQSGAVAADTAFYNAVRTSALANRLPAIAADCNVALQSLWGQGKI